MSKTPQNPQRQETQHWERGWDEHERMQRRRLARLPLAAKLEWLEQAQRVVMQLQKAKNSANST